MANDRQEEDSFDVYQFSFHFAYFFSYHLISLIIQFSLFLYYKNWFFHQLIFKFFKYFSLCWG